eukprot:1159979-Pelagomonas_calceolata.AAC.4
MAPIHHRVIASHVGLESKAAETVYTLSHKQSCGVYAARRSMVLALCAPLTLCGRSGAFSVMGQPDLKPDGHTNLAGFIALSAMLLQHTPTHDEAQGTNTILSVLSVCAPTFPNIPISCTSEDKWGLSAPSTSTWPIL